ncbi:MAG TPA: flagellar biosynthetic protein FliO [Bauldia sp.]|nr:flagellar biosynthetic protein FliO [Bauldia sp.]
MREMLEPWFGSGGAVIAQFIITLAVVLALVAVVVWLVRRYAAGGLGTTVRGRLPRLAVIDALAVDNRRRLVLVRRDNVEHLLLIGGPADVVVESGIVRARAVAQRQPASARPQSAAAEPAGETPPAAVAAPAVEPAAAVRPDPVAERPIPFPPRRTERNNARRDPRQPVPVRDAEDAAPWQNLRSVLGAPREEARVTPFVPPPPLALEPADEAPPAPPIDTPVAEAEAAPSEAAAPQPLADEPVETPREQEAGEDEVELPSFLAPGAKAAEPPIVPEAPSLAAEVAEPGEPAPDAATRVNDLEREMARLLGEISARRTS